MQNPTHQQHQSKHHHLPHHHPQTPNSQTSEVKYIYNVEVKSKLSGLKSKIIQIHPNTNKLIIYDNQADKDKGKVKQHPLDKVTCSHQKREDKGKKDCLEIDTNDGKKYSLRGTNTEAIADQIKNSQLLYKIRNSQAQQQVMGVIPKQVNFMTPYGMNHLQKMFIPSTNNLFPQNFSANSTLTQSTQPSQDFSKYPRRPFYFSPQDWQINPAKGKISFINEEKKKSQKKVLGWIVKKFLKQRSFMGISFPTFVMKPQTILESYAKAIGAAPLLFDCVTNPVERMKKFVCLFQSFSLLFCDLSKPFNPPLGQTFQARIGPGNFYAEQISHHPPISAFMYEGKGYILSGTMQLTANIGPNSASGSFLGDLKVSFDDGAIYVGRLPVGQFSGFMMGSQKFEASGSFYAYNNKHLVCSISSVQKKSNFFAGYIGKLKPKFELEFMAQISSQGRFSKFPSYERQCFETVFSSLQMCYNSTALFDGKEYFNASDGRYFPLLPEPITDEKLMLKSDSRMRKDVTLRRQLKYDESQLEKEKIEEQERYFRKLRSKNDPKNLETK